jgi:Helix-turn-helix domain
MNVICLNEDAFYTLIDIVVERVRAKETYEREWVSPKEAMAILNIKSKTTLQKLRDEGKVEYSQIGRKLIQYKRISLLNYINHHKKASFSHGK